MSNPAAASAAASSLPPTAAAIASPAPRPGPRKRSTTASSKTLTDAADVTVPSSGTRRGSRELSTPVREEDYSPSENEDFGKNVMQPAYGEGVSEKASLPRTSNKAVAQVLDNIPRRESLPTRPKVLKLSLQAKPADAVGGASMFGHPMRILVSRPFVAFIIVAGLATTLWSWRSPSPSPYAVTMEGQVADLEKVLRKTTKMMQVQLDLVDMKILKEVEGLRKELEVKIGEQATSFGTELRNMKSKTDDIGASLKKLIETGFPTKQEVSNLISSVVEERASEGSGEALSLDDVRAVARRLVETELDKHAADGIGRVDYALGTGGGKVVDHSEGFYHGLGIDWRHYLPGSKQKHSLANKVLEPSFGEPGQCLPLKGRNVYIEIALRTSIFPEAFSLEHVSRAVAYDISSAPKEFRVFGWLDSYKEEDASFKPMAQVLLGDFVYDINKKSVQTFVVPHESQEKLINMVRLEVLSNYGSRSHTCIYRFRVHGAGPKPASPASA